MSVFSAFQERAARTKRNMKPFTIDCDGKAITISSMQDAKNFRITCPAPKVLKLAGGSGVLPRLIDDPDVFYSFVNASELHMCVWVEHSSLIELDLTKVAKIVGNCNGPLLKIYGNDQLQTIKLNYTLMRRSPIASVFIRGNRALTKQNINKMNDTFADMVVDLQEQGECGLPLSLKNTSFLNGCTQVYGIVYVDKNTRKIERAPNSQGYNLIGCIDISGTELEDVDFLDDVKEFTFMKSCPHMITNNQKLCVREPLVLKEKFPGLYIQQNTSTCETHCDGGHVDDVYLENLVGCNVINGDLVIEDIYKRPSRLHFLENIKKLNGTLKVIGTKSLGDFSMDNLREISAPDKGPAIQIAGNAGLKSVTFPQLSKLASNDDIKVIIINNPKLKMKIMDIKTLERLSKGKKHVKIEYADATTMSDRLQFYKMFVLAGLLLLLILLLIFLIIAVLVAKAVKRRRLYNKYGFPNPPWLLDKKSKEILIGWVKDILKKNPLIWRCSDREYIWPYQKTDGTHKDIDVLVTNNQSFLNEHMLPLAANGRISEKDNFFLAERVKSIVNKENAVMIGTDRDPSCVLPKLPTQKDGQYTYKYLGNKYDFTLKRTQKVAPNTIEYQYDVVAAPSGKPVEKKRQKIFYYRWDSRKMPTEFDEVLQLAALCSRDTTVCISDKRKEVFSLIHMFLTYCYTLKENIELKDALQLHTEKCNGCLIDRSELVYVFAVIMEWAYQSRALPKELKEGHKAWCHSYAIMSKFMRNNPNIKLIHPDHLPQLDPKTAQQVKRDGFNISPRFSPRDSVAVKDPYRMKGSAGKPNDLNAAKKGAAETEQKPDKTKDDEEFWTKMD
ncbi:hypothetical protein Q1695_010417 [Nippostrongylus brasiliensis]|nr:hypothetical protein Q1695_010417 [Nippostrongylus brasiliensis]